MVSDFSIEGPLNDSIYRLLWVRNPTRVGRAGRYPEEREKSFVNNTMFYTLDSSSHAGIYFKMTKTRIILRLPIG